MTRSHAVRQREIMTNLRAMDRPPNGWRKYFLYSGTSGKTHTTRPSMVWIKTKKRPNKDSLIRYMVQARNAEEHGVEPVIAQEAGSIGIHSGNPHRLTRMADIVINGDGIRLLSPSIDVGTGQVVPTIVEQKPSRPRLVTVVDTRFGTEFPPPTEHNGKSLNDVSPYQAATLYLNYLEQLVSEAESLMRA